MFVLVLFRITPMQTNVLEMEVLSGPLLVGGIEKRLSP